jgi:hypothetical protein
MAPKYHPTPLSGGDRKALAKELGKARAMANILASQSMETRAKGEALIQQADKLLCESWNERMWSDGEPQRPRTPIGRLASQRDAVAQARAASRGVAIGAARRRRSRASTRPADLTSCAPHVDFERERADSKARDGKAFRAVLPRRRPRQGHQLLILCDADWTV